MSYSYSLMDSAPPAMMRDSFPFPSIPQPAPAPITMPAPAPAPLPATYPPSFDLYPSSKLSLTDVLLIAILSMVVLQFIISLVKRV